MGVEESYPERAGRKRAGGNVTVVDVFHFFGGLCIGLLAGVILGVLVSVRGLR